MGDLPSLCGGRHTRGMTCQMISGFRDHATKLITLLDVENDDLLVSAMSLDNGACWQSRSNVLLGFSKHGCSCGCQASRGRNFVFGISAISCSSEETSEHSECGSPVLAQSTGVVRRIGSQLVVCVRCCISHRTPSPDRHRIHCHLA